MVIKGSCPNYMGRHAVRGVRWPVHSLDVLADPTPEIPELPVVLGDEMAAIEYLKAQASVFVCCYDELNVFSPFLG